MGAKRRASAGPGAAEPEGIGRASLELAAQPLTWLLVAMPAALASQLWHADDVWVFLLSAIAVVPLAGMMGRATEHLANAMGPGIGGLLNATFGNAAELIIGLLIVSRGPAMYPLVKASITGSIIGNVLLVLGMATLFGGARHRVQHFNRTAAAMGSTLLALASIGLIMPSMSYYLFRAGSGVDARELGRVESLSDEIAVILAVVYVLYLAFSLWTHRELFGSGSDPADTREERPRWTRSAAVVVLLTATVGVAVMGEMLVGALERAGQGLGLNQVFLGVVVVATVGNAAEHSTAVAMALKDRMELAVQIAIGSSLQIALFVAPMLVFASIAMRTARPLDLHFTPLELIAVTLAVGILALVAQDGETNWMEGALLIAVYAIIGLAFYNLPMS